MAPESSIKLILLMFSLTSLYFSGYANPYNISSDHVLSFSLTHRDAKRSPLRSLEADPSDLPQDMPMHVRAFVAAGRALRARLNWQRTLSYGGDQVGDFFLTLPVGTPSQEVIFLVDTGSELSFSECSPCLNCTRTTVPRFAYHNSSSFLAVTCGSPLCRNSVGFKHSSAPCKADTALCNFVLAFGDGSKELGFLSVDSFDLGGPKFSQPFVFGCATTVQETVISPSSGLLGLDAGPFSFTSQLFVSSPGMPKKFTYCLPDRFKSLNAAGTIKFGNYKQPSRMKYTPFAPPFGPLGSVFYYVALQGITVGECLIKVDMQGLGTIFDSGSAVTSLVKPLYDKLVGEMRRQTAHLGPFDASGTELASDLCYEVPARAKNPPNVPRISMHFAGGVDLELGPESVLYGDQIKGDNTSTYFCLAFRTRDMNIVGNYQQQNYWVEYDLDTLRLGLAKANCAHST